MIKYQIEETDLTPNVILNYEESTIQIVGKSIMPNPADFYTSLIEKIEDFIYASENPILIDLQFEFFNISSSKEIVKMLHKCGEYFEDNKDITVHWNFNQFDEHMEDLGKDFAFMVKFPFIVKMKNEVLSYELA